MINLELKAKHLFYITEYISYQSLFDYFRLLNELSNKLKSQYTGDDEMLITVETNSTEVLSIFTILANLPEGQVVVINAEMLELIFPQIQAGIIEGNEEWIYIYNTIITTRAANIKITASKIENGKRFLGF